MSNAPLLYLPNSVKPSGEWARKSPPKPLHKKPSKKWLKHLEAFGRKVGVSAGGYMDDLSAQQKAIWLCRLCRHKFDYKRAHYFYEKNMRVRGKCDGCREFDVDSHLFIHESTIHAPGEMNRHGHVWTPR